MLIHISCMPGVPDPYHFPPHVYSHATPSRGLGSKAFKLQQRIALEGSNHHGCCLPLVVLGEA